MIEQPTSSSPKLRLGLAIALAHFIIFVVLFGFVGGSASAGGNPIVGAGWHVHAWPATVAVPFLFLLSWPGLAGFCCQQRNLGDRGRFVGLAIVATSA